MVALGFKIDGGGRLVGEAWVPLAGLDVDEWALYVRTVARACDRVEYLLSGRDELRRRGQARSGEVFGTGS